MVTEANSPMVAKEAAQLKHKSAGSMADSALQHALKLAVEGASVESICRDTDAFILGQGWGIAFPCCVSTNKQICHYSPLQGDADVVLKIGDVIKIELGTLFEGYPALVASTVIVAQEKVDATQNKVVDVGIRLIETAKKALSSALEIVQGGAESGKVAQSLRKTVEDGGASWVEGMMSHGISFNSINHGGTDDSNGMLIVNPAPEQARAYPSFKFAAGQVYVIDVALTTAALGGKYNVTDAARPTVFRVTGQSQSLRLKTSRAVMGEIGKLIRRPGEKPPTSTSKPTANQQIAFHIRQLENAIRARVALHECTSAGVANAYPVMEVRASGACEADQVNVRLMATVVVGDSRCELITNPIVA